MKISREAIEAAKLELGDFRIELHEKILEDARSSIIWSIAGNDLGSAVLTAFKHITFIGGQDILKEIPEEFLKQGADILMDPKTPVKGADNDGYERRQMYEAAKTAYGLLGLSKQETEAEEKIKKDLKWRNEWDNLNRDMPN